MRKPSADRQPHHLTGQIRRIYLVCGALVTGVLTLLLLLFQPERDPGKLLVRNYTSPTSTASLTQRTFTQVNTLGSGIIQDIAWSPQQADSGDSYLAVRREDTLSVYRMTAPYAAALPEPYLEIEVRHANMRVKFSPDGTRLALTDGSALDVWDLRTKRPIARDQNIWRSLVYTPDTVIFTPDSNGLVLPVENNAVIGIRAIQDSEQLISEFPSGLVSTPPQFMAFNPDGTQLVVVDYNMHLRILNDPTRQWTAETTTILDPKVEPPPLQAQAQMRSQIIPQLITGTPTAPSPIVTAVPPLMPAGTPIGATSILNASGVVTLSPAMTPTIPPVAILPTIVPAQPPFPQFFSSDAYRVAAAFNPDGTRLALFYVNQYNPTDATVLVIDPRSGGEITRFAAADMNHPLNTMYAYGSLQPTIAYSPDGELITTQFGDVRFWDVATGRHLRTVPANPTNQPQFSLFSLSTRAAFSPDWQVFAWVDLDGTLYLVDSASGDYVAQLSDTATMGSITSLEFSPDGTKLVSASTDYGVRLWDIRDPANVPLPQLVPHDLKPPASSFIILNYPTLRLHFDPDAPDQLGLDDGFSRMQRVNLIGQAVSDVVTLNLPSAVPYNPPYGVRSFTSDMVSLANPHYENAIIYQGNSFALFDRDGLRRRFTVRSFGRYTGLHTLSPDGRLFAAAFLRYKPWGQLKSGIEIYDLTRSVGFTLPGTQDDIVDLAIMPDNQRLVTANLLGVLRFHEFDSGRVSLTITQGDPTSRYVSMQISSDSQILALQMYKQSSRPTFTVKLYSTATGALLAEHDFVMTNQRFFASYSSADAFAINADATLLAYSDQAGFIDLYTIR